MSRPRPGRSLVMAVAICLLFAPAVLALDPPHDAAPGPSDCADCHSTHAAVGFFGINQQYVQDLCAACHDGVTATQVETHLDLTKGPWLGRDYDGNGQDVVCIDCHDPHTQLSALGQNFVGFRGSGSTNILRQTPGGERVILYDGTGSRGSYIKNSPDSGICETCHSVTTTFTFGSDTDDHFGNASSQACTACHDHSDGWIPQGGNCVQCHSSSQGSRRQITGAAGEFDTSFTAHHVNDGTGAEIVTQWDCSVCHAEGDVLTGEPDGTYHQLGGVQLKNVDTGVALGDWATLTASERSGFCLSCHDSDGATIVTARTDPDPDATTDALNPFNDGLSNAHEPAGFDGTAAPHSRGAVLDVETQFDPLNTSHHAVLGQAYGTPNPFSGTCNGGSNDGNACATDTDCPGGTCETPNKAIQGVRTDLAWDSTMNCEDCHYGTPSTMLSGHGTANARYMLRDKDGNDTLATGANVNCYRCHNPSDAVSVYPEHDKGAHIDDALNLFGVSCLNCHGGGTFGGIHGVDNTVTDDDGGGTYNPNVFTFGSGLDLITNWTSWAKNGVTCSATANPTLLSDCTQHGSTRYERIGDTPTRTYRNP